MEDRFIDGNEFSCGLEKAISWAQINDDFCDCPDGSDEPGTSGCAHSSGARFYCVNKGHRGRWVPASRVDDGVCDCCDGSDEQFGCQDTCQAEANAAHAAAAEKIKTLEDGARLKLE